MGWVRAEKKRIRGGGRGKGAVHWTDRNGVTLGGERFFLVKERPSVRADALVVLAPALLHILVVDLEVPLLALELVALALEPGTLALLAQRLLLLELLERALLVARLAGESVGRRLEHF